MISIIIQITISILISITISMMISIMISSMISVMISIMISRIISIMIPRMITIPGWGCAGWGCLGGRRTSMLSKHNFRSTHDLLFVRQIKQQGRTSGLPKHDFRKSCATSTHGCAGLQWGKLGENNLGDFCFPLIFSCIFWGFWGLYYSKMAN